jgi:Uma2 family endonuclease
VDNAMTATLTPSSQLDIVWEKLPANFVLPDDPVENIYQPFLAAALTEALDLEGLVKPEMLLASNMGICAKVAKRTVVKAPDWFYVPQANRLTGGEIRRSYTPYAEGDIPAVVMEFLSDTETGEYSIRPTFPYGKLYYYEKILRVPVYIIFDPDLGLVEVRELQGESYEVQTLDENGRYWIESMGLSIGVWYGKRIEMETHWLRWWDQEGNLLLWGNERIAIEQQRVEAERQRAEQERQRAEAEHQRAERLAARLRELGIEES